MAELTKTQLAALEEDFRMYHKIPSKIAEALVAFGELAGQQIQLTK